MVRLKAGVELGDVLTPAMAFMLDALKRDSLTHTITSGRDSHSTGQHPLGNALDLRLKDKLEGTREAYCQHLRILLGRRFTVIHEGAGTENEHAHMQVKKGTTFTMQSYLS